MINILGIHISRLKREKVRELIGQWLEESNHRFIVTPNPEIILGAQKDEELFYILNHADLAPADGFGLKIAAWAKGDILHRFTGADMTRFLLEEAEDKGLRALIVFWKDGLSDGAEISRALGSRYPKLKHLELGLDRKLNFSEGELAEINGYQPEIMFVALGSPWQEKLIFHDYQKIKPLKIAIGVGGSFDFLTGKLERAPYIFRKFGLEWLWRLHKQPSRIKRILNATFVFMYKDFVDTFIRPMLYRPNVAVIIYKIEAGKPYILLVERSDDIDHWQLPQGGTDGESLKEAATREMREELGLDIEVKATYLDVYKYRSNRNGKHKRGYKGQKQGLAIARKKDEKQEVKINYWDHQDWGWFAPEEAIGKIYPIRQESANIFINRFQDYLKKYEK